MPVKILVVDDEPYMEPLVRQIFRKEIRRKELDFVFALNGLEALDKLQTEPGIDVVLTDIRMPAMDGLALLAELKDMKANYNPVLTTVIISAFDDLENIRKAMNLGAYDFLTKPIDTQDFRITVDKTIRHARQLKTALEQERLRMLGQLTTVLAHEMNNPLQAIRSNLDLILDLSLEVQESKKRLQIIHHQLERLANITDHVLNLAKADPAPHQTTCLIESVQQVLTLVDKQLRQNNIQVTTNFQPAPNVLAAPSQLNQIFLNLVLNAIEAAPDQGHLHLAIYPEQDYVVTTVINYDFTIASEVLPHIFEPFFTTKSEGSGLGLWLCYTLVQQHQGALTVENLEDGKGVVSAVKLPLSRE